MMSETLLINPRNTVPRTPHEGLSRLAPHATENKRKKMENVISSRYFATLHIWICGNQLNIVNDLFPCAAMNIVLLF